MSTGLEKNMLFKFCFPILIYFLLGGRTCLLVLKKLHYKFFSFRF